MPDIQKYVNMDNETIKKKIFALRERQGLSWADLATRTGAKSYRNILNSLNSPGLTLATLEKIATALNVQAYELIKPDDTPGAGCQAYPTPARLSCPLCGGSLIIAPERQNAGTAPAVFTGPQEGPQARQHNGGAQAHDDSSETQNQPESKTTLFE